MCKIAVTTLRVVWIEISGGSEAVLMAVSPPCGWCGLKSVMEIDNVAPFIVTTLRVVWIEINWCMLTNRPMKVTTLRVVWIEIRYYAKLYNPNCGHHLAGGVD